MRPKQVLGFAVVLLTLVGPMCIPASMARIGEPAELSAANSIDAKSSHQRTGPSEMILAAKKKKTNRKTKKQKAKKSKRKCQKCGAWRYCGMKLQNAIDFGICD